MPVPVRLITGCMIKPVVFDSLPSHVTAPVVPSVVMLAVSVRSANAAAPSAGEQLKFLTKK